MYLPPAAAWKVDRARWPCSFVAVTGLLGISLCLWLAVRQPWGASSIILLVLPGLCLLAAVVGLRYRATGQLLWDGEHWHWISSADCEEHRTVTQMVCVIDLQRLMLLRLVCEPPAVRWLWLESDAMDTRWLALRRAVVAGPRSLQMQQSNVLPE